MLYSMKQTLKKTNLSYDTLKFYCNERKRKLIISFYLALKKANLNLSFHFFYFHKIVYFF